MVFLKEYIKLKHIKPTKEFIIILISIKKIIQSWSMEEIGSVKKYIFRNLRDFESLVNNNVNV